jgi:hypothetical protein
MYYLKALLGHNKEEGGEGRGDRSKRARVIRTPKHDEHLSRMRKVTQTHRLRERMDAHNEHREWSPWNRWRKFEVKNSHTGDDKQRHLSTTSRLYMMLAMLASFESMVLRERFVWPFASIDPKQTALRDTIRINVLRNMAIRSQTDADMCTAMC